MGPPSRTRRRRRRRGPRRPRRPATRPRPAAQLPRAGAGPVPAGVARPGAAAVHRRRQQRGAAVHPRPAALGVRVGEAGEQLLRLRHGQRHRVHGRLSDHQAPHVRAGRAAVDADGGSAGAAALRQGARGGPGAGARVPAGVGGQHLRDELRLAVGQRRGGAQPGRGPGRLPAQHRRGRPVAVPPARRGLVFQLGTAYFGCRDARGRFDLARLRDLVAGAPVRALEVKLSQGAKPSLGGLLPGAKVSAEIAATRGVPQGRDCVSPSRHAEFSDCDSLLDWVELLAAETGLPVGIKSAVGDLGFWAELADLMRDTGRGVDFVTVDGGEGGTGAAPLIFTDSVSLPFQQGFSRVYRVFAERGLHEQVVFVGGGKLGLPDNAVVAFALGCDMVNVGREAMLAIGCIQAQKCHTDTCPTGVATQHPWLARGLDPARKSVRAANYLRTLRRDLVRVAEACGVEHPGLIDADSVEILDGRTSATPLREVYGYRPDWGLPSAADRAEIVRLMTPRAPRGGTATPSPTAVG
ncbi:FMN-binding glutamate synthase family protein [Micromonospora carbonacea]|uniref:FMN-binding glutamate synthase family protein n=1 Tax=Micromonospora carbonacea TaxID=47853 RepID=UPI0037221DB9